MTRNSGRFDLHVHTTHSDGGCSPHEVVRAAANVGLSGLAITDHDTLSAIPVARDEANRLGIELIAGCELTSQLDDREYHLLAYFIREDDPDLQAACRDLRERREARIERICNGLSALGLQIDLEKIRKTFPRATIGRKHVADWLVRSGQVASHREVFERYLGEGGQVQAPKPRLPAIEAIRLVQQAGGVVALAHPPYDLREQTLERFVEIGLQAIEVQGPGIARSRQPRLLDWASRLDLVPTAGSDFHANDRPGRWVGSITTSRAELQCLRDRCGNSSLP